jgi:hypothetical protein
MLNLHRESAAGPPPLRPSYGVAVITTVYVPGCSAVEPTTSSLADSAKLLALAPLSANAPDHPLGATVIGQMTEPAANGAV